MSFIVLDIETGGLSSLVNPILSIGAVDYLTGDEFYGECHAWIDGFSYYVIDDAALAVNGFTREQALDLSKPRAYDLVLSFLKWSDGRAKVLAGQQVGAFDIPFVKANTTLPGTNMSVAWPFSHRSLDLHSTAYAKLNKSLSLDGILETVGLSPEPKPHNALTGARLEAAAFRLLLGSTCGCQAEGWKS